MKPYCDECVNFICNDWAFCAKCGHKLKSATDKLQALIDLVSKTTTGRRDSFEQNHNLESSCMIGGSNYYAVTKKLQNITSIDGNTSEYNAKNQHLWNLVKTKIDRIFGGECIFAGIDPGYIYNASEKTVKLLRAIHANSPDVKLLSLLVCYRRKCDDIIYCGVTVLFFSKEEVEKYMPGLYGNNWLKLSSPLGIGQEQNNDTIYLENMPAIYSLHTILRIFKSLFTAKSLQSLIE